MSTPTPVPPALPADWRRQRTTPISTTLPYSGLVVDIGPVQLDALLLAGKIPDVLTGIVASVLWSTVGQGKKEEEIRAEKDFYALVNAVVSACLVTPRVVENPSQDDEIAIDELSFADKLLVYTIATQPASVLYRFRQEQVAAVDALPEGEAVLETTE